MTYSPPSPDWVDHHLPDPVTQPEFYADVTAKRAFAWVIDLIVVAAIVVPVILLTLGIALFFIPFLFLVLSFAYRVITIANGSATWGMRMMGIELRNARGERFDLGMAFLHTLGYSLAIGTALVQIVSVVLMATTERGQGLSDLFLGTVMINRRGL